MNQTASGPFPGNSSPADRSEAIAVFVLDATGRIVATNQSARGLWVAPGTSLIGTAFGSLFARGGDFAARDQAETEWKDLTAASLDEWAAFTAQPRSGSPLDVRVRIERAVGGAGSFIALVQTKTR